MAEIVNIEDETPTIKTFALKLKDGPMDFKPGQFIELTVFGAGEAPFAISSSPFEKEIIQVSVMQTFNPVSLRKGRVTSALFTKKPGDLVGIRGPYGNGYPIEKCIGDVTIVGGGIGASTLRSLILYLMREGKCRKITFFYGARTPADLVFKKDLEEWKKLIDVHVTVDNPQDGWTGHVGVVTTLFDKVPLDFSRDIAFVCGPPIMIKFTVKKLLECGFTSDKIFVSLERFMQCGIGKCGHCNIGKYFVCKDGPIFSYEQIKDIPEIF